MDLKANNDTPRSHHRRGRFFELATLRLALAGFLVLVSGCASPDYIPKNTVSVDTSITVPRTDGQQWAPGYPRLGGTSPGSLLTVAPEAKVPDRLLETGATLLRVTYRTDAGEPVAALVAIPGGQPPKGGWPLIAFNHGNTGVNFNCGPTLYADLMNQSLSITALVENGFAVVATDYQGISGNPASPGLAFLDAQSLGTDVLNGVLATRELGPQISRKWALAGGSLGGAASWGAAGLATNSALGEDLVGAAIWVPVVNVSGLVAKAQSNSLTVDQRHLYFLTVLQLARTSRPSINLRDYIRGDFYANRDLLTYCTGPRIQEAIRVIDSADPGDLKPASQRAADAMVGYLDELRPDSETKVPMVVVYATDDKLVDYPWIEEQIDLSCRAGSRIQWEKRRGEGHDNVQASWVFSWLYGQFQGQSSTDLCPTGPIRDGN